MEIWRSVVGYEGLYEVSDLGRVQSLDRRALSASREAQKLKGKVLRPGVSSTGYLSVALSRDGKPKSWNIHVLVAAAFHGPRPDQSDIDHIDGARTNNIPANLRYVSTAVNCRNTTKANSVSGVLGVYKNGSGWAAQIRWNGRQHHIGTFRSIAEARDARLAFEEKIDWRGLSGIDGGAHLML